MSKPAKPKQPSLCRRIRHGRENYYCWIKGKQHCLGIDRQQAEAKFAALLGGTQAQAAPQAAPEPQPVKQSITVAHVLRKYVEWLEKETAAGRSSDGTLKYYKRPLVGLAKKQKAFVPFLDFVGEITVDEFGEHTVIEWIDTHYSHGADNYKI